MSRLALLKELFTLNKKSKQDYFTSIKAESVQLKMRLLEIEKRYFFIPSDKSLHVENIPAEILWERQEIHRKLEVFRNQITREYDRRHRNRIIFWSWFFGWRI